jgi:hypothetical protein
MTMRRALFALLAVTMLSSCDGGAPLIVPLRDDQGAAARVAGTWAGTASVAGHSLLLTLAVQDTVISGSGTYSSQIQSGTLQVEGSATRSGVRLNLFFDDLRTAHFVGTQPSSTQLTGTLTYDPVNGTASNQLITFTKQ